MKNERTQTTQTPANPMNKITIPAKLADKGRTAAAQVNLDLATLARIGLGRVIEEINATGKIEVHRTRTAAPLSPTTAARVEAINRTLDLAEPGLAELFISEILGQIMRGEYEFALDCYEFEQGREWAESQLAALVESWKAEDTAQGADQPDADTVSAIAAQIAAQDAQEREQRRSPAFIITEAANAQEGRE